MGKSNFSLFSALILISVLWKPAFADKCSIECRGAPGSQAFSQGSKYNYGVEGTVTVYLTGADKQETSVKLLGQVSVTALGNCGHELAVQNLVISGPDGKKYQSPPGIDKPIQFSLQDGRLSPEICAQEGDTRRSLNIKRAIISLLQTEQKSATQVDIFGACPTDITYSQEGGSVLIHRARDLSRCAHREQGSNDLISSVLNPGAEIKESHVLRSSLNVETKINNGVPEKISAAEEYLYKPFSVGENGARAKVYTKLTLTGKNGGGGPNGECTESRTVIFEAPHGDSSAPNNVNNALTAVKDTAKTLNREADERSAGKFAQLVRILRQTGKDDLLKVYNQVKGISLEKRVYLDALLRTGTGPSIEASVQILKGGSLSNIEQQLVYLSLGNSKHVNSDGLKAATTLLDQHNIPKELYLGVGALAGVYCRQHKCHTVKSDGIVALSNKLGSKLQNCKPKSKVDEDYVVAVLKGIRNIRHLENSLVDKLEHCVKDHAVKPRVKVAALEAFHADPCTAKLKKAALDLLKNRNFDSEIRIQAYLAVIACPCGRSANEIKTLLDTEPVHQVGRFITSSLRAIRSSSNPDKRLAKQHYGLISIPNRFHVDDRKYSFNREQSYNVDAIGAGGSIEETVIFSQDSFIPRSGALNITTEIFGHSFNVLELGARQGNLDLVVEHFLGPKGLLKREGAQALYDTILKAFLQSNEKVKSALSRGRRSVKTEIDGFDKALKGEQQHYDNELDLDVYGKLFGTDIIFLSLGDDKGFDFNKAVDQFVNLIVNGIDKAKHLSQELRANLLFLDAELSYPTSIGIPLKLDLIGAATTRVDLASNFDLKECLNNPKNAKIDIKIIPSSDIEIFGIFLIDADVIATGLKVVTNLHSSTGAHLVAKVLENGHGIDIQLGLPVDKQEIVVASNDLVYFTAEKGHAEKQIKIAVDGEKKEYSACFDQLSGILGLTLCSEVSLPFSVSGPDAQTSISKYLARYPLTGHSRVKLVLEKNDLKGYHIRGVVRSEGGRDSFELLFDAEGSKNRRTQLTGEKFNTNSEIGVKLALESPIKTLYGEASFRNTQHELWALLKAKVDAQEYFGKVGFTIQGNNARSVYKPIFEYQIPDDQGKKSVQIDGQVIKETNGPAVKYSFDGIKLNLPNQEPIGIEGYYSSQPNPRNIEWEVVSKLVTLKGSLKNNELLLEFLNKLNPAINFKVKGHSEFGDVIKNEIDLVHSGDLKDANRRVVISQFLKYNKKGGENLNVITKNKLEIYALAFKLGFNADIDPKKVDVDFEFKNADQKADANLKARTHIKRPEDYSVKLVANVNKGGLEVFSKRDLINADKSNFENYLSLKGVGKYELSGVVLHRIKTNDLNVGAVGHLKISGGGKNEEIKFDVGTTETSALYSTHGKVSGRGGDIIDLLVKVSRGANPNGQLKFILKDTVAANGQFQVTDNDGKGNGMVIVDFKKSQRKIKADVKFTAKDPVFNGDFDIYLNFEKDNNDKICFKTNNRRTEKLVDSKNKLEYGGKATEFNFKVEGEVAFYSKSKADIEIVLPTERWLSFNYNRDVSENGGATNGQVTAILSDAPKRGAGASTIKYIGKVRNTNPEKDTYDYEGQVELKLKDGKNLVNTYVFKNQPHGEKSNFEFKTDVKGNLLPKPASLSLSGDYLNSITEEDSKYKAHASYGDDYRADAEGIWVIKYKDGGDKKYLDDYTVTLRLPFEKAHDLKFVNTYLVLQPEGKDTVEYTIIESVQVNADVYKVDASGKLGPKAGSGTVKLLVPHVDPVVIDAGYKHDKKGDRIDNSVEVKARYGKGKSAHVSVESAVTPNGNDVAFKAHAPQNEKFKKLEFTIHSKNPAPDTYYSSWVVDADGRIYKSESNIVLSKAHPVLDIKYTSPSNSKPSRIYVKGSSLSSTQGKIEAKIENIRDVTLDLVSEASVQKDNVNFKINANSEKLNWKNFVGEIVSKDAGSGKRLEFHFTNDNKNVLSGSTSFISKQEGQKTIIEGSGSVKIQNDQKSANFKYIRTILADGNEKGVETFFNIAFGERSYVAESRITNLEYKNSHVYCEEKKQCAHAELQSKIDISKQGVIANIINAGFDLRKLGIAPELGLIIRDEVSANKLPQYTLDLHANKDDRKYHLHVFNTPVYGHAQSGIKIQLPQRVILLENSVTYPTDRPIPFPIKGELVLDLDKNKPGHKASARFLVNVDVDKENRQSAVAEFGFSHPRIEREALIRISGGAFKVKENTYKFETAALISHSALGHDRESKILLEGSPTHLKFLINTPIVKVIDIDASATLKDKLQKVDLKFVLLENKPVQVHALAKDYQYFEFTTAEADRKLSVVGHIDPEKRIDFSADILLSGQKKNLVHGAMWLDQNLVKSDYGANKEHVNYFLKAVRKDIDDLEARIKELGEKAGKDLKEISQRVQPTLKKLEQAYTEDLKKMYQEIADDKVLKDISQAFHDIAVFVAKLIDDVVQGTKPVVDEIVKIYADLTKKFQELYEKQIEPQLKAIYGTISKALKEYIDAVIDIVAHVAALFTDFYEKHKGELQELTNTFAEIFKDLSRLLVAQLKEIRTKLAEFSSHFTEWAKDLPIISTIKEKWSELAVPEQAGMLLAQAHTTIRPILPTPELQQFADSLNEYLLKKLQKEKLDDTKELKVVYQKLVNAVASLIQFVRNQLNVIGVPTTPTDFTSWTSWTPSAAGSSPTFGGETSFSVLKQLLNGDFPDILSIIRAYRPRSLNPLDEIPAKLRGVVVNGQHIFTFDGRHLTFPGTCRYVLAHDHVDRNFTLLIQLKEGKPQALVLEDKNGNILELKNNGQASLNGANHGYPIAEKDSFAFRQTNGRIGLGSTYGIMAYCTGKLEVCYIEVNGFYLGKLRGLLGDGNNEPYDDFRLPSGKISTSESEFGNAYRLARSCAQVQVPAHDHHQLHAALPEACEQVFGGASPLRPLGLILDVAPFRQACIHAVAANPTHALQEACDLGRGYLALGVTGLAPGVLPSACVQCTDADKPRNIGEVYEVKIPSKQADIIVSVETIKDNEKTFKELVVPLVLQVIDQIKKKGATDIKVYLIGATSEYPHAIVYDTDLKLKNKIDFKDESRYDLIKPIKTGQEKVDRAIQQVVDILNTAKTGLSIINVVRAYNDLLDLPLRPGAVKFTVSTVGERCRPEFFLSQAVREAFIETVMEDLGMQQLLVASVDGLSIGNGKSPQQVVGFTKDAVLLLGDKKWSKESHTLRETLDYDDNSCAEVVEEAGGLVVPSTVFSGLQAGQQKQFIQTVATSVTQKLFAEQLIQECTCTYVDPFRVRSVCVTKQRKEAARRRK